MLNIPSADWTAGDWRLLNSHTTCLSLLLGTSVFDLRIRVSSFTPDSAASPLIRHLTHLSWIEDLISGPQTASTVCKTAVNYVKHPTVILPRYWKNKRCTIARSQHQRIQFTSCV